VPSPDGNWVYLREYHRSFVVPFTLAGKAKASALRTSLLSARGWTPWLSYRRPTHYLQDELRHVRLAQELAKIYRRGFKINMGAHGQMMGIGAHWEIEMFVDGGFRSHEAL
jgi:hypothetical protein